MLLHGEQRAGLMMQGSKMLPVIGLVAVLASGALVAVTVWPGPQWMAAAEANRLAAEKQREVERQAAEKKRKQEEAEKAELLRKEAEYQRIVLNGSDEELDGLIRDCKNSISRALSKSFYFYFPHYTAGTLDKIITLAGASINIGGSPQLFVDPEDVNAFNRKRIREKIYRSIAIAVEVTVEDFSGNRPTAAIYECGIGATDLEEPEKTKWRYADPYP